MSTQYVEFKGQASSSLCEHGNSRYQLIKACLPVNMSNMRSIEASHI